MGLSRPPIVIHDDSQSTRKRKIFRILKEDPWIGVSENIMRENMSLPENGKLLHDKGFVNDKTLQIHERTDILIDDTLRGRLRSISMYRRFLYLIPLYIVLR